MLIRFHGADRTVTGSCHLIEANGLRIMLDFGMYQGSRELARTINATVPDDLKRIDAVILSHGHLDHCGRLPMLWQSGYRHPIYCTPATAEVARVVMTDAAQIQEEDFQYLSRRSIEAARTLQKPLFTRADVDAVRTLFKTVPYARTTDLGKGVRFTFFDAGHILGSSYILLEADENGVTRKLLFTADIGRYDAPILRDPAPIPGPVDAVITESTYGTVRHAPMAEVGPQLLEILQESIRKKGRLILPSFAVGRTQTMLWYVQRFIQAGQIPAIPLFVDSPMGSEVSRITTQYSDDYDDETRAAVCDDKECNLFGTSSVTFALTSEDSRRINSVAGACVIIASSPTCEFGRILHHLKRSVENPNDTVVFVGWTPPNTLGRRLQEGSRAPLGARQQVRILDRVYDLRCAVKTLHGLSAHADGDELLRFLAPTLRRETTAFVVHGEADRCDGFAARLTAAGIGAAIAPATQSVAILGAAPVSLSGAAVAMDE